MRNCKFESISFIRTIFGVTQEEFATILGITSQTLSKSETNKNIT